MNNKKQKKTKKVFNPSWAHWQKLWAEVESPWRPSKKDILFCEKMIKMVLRYEKNPKALLLGSTPEIRDLLAKYKIETTLVDVNSSMKKAMDKLLKRKNRKEKLIVADWVKMKLPKSYFNLAFSDGCLTNISLATWRNLFTNVNQALKKNGLLYSGSWVYRVLKPLSFEDLIEKYKKNPKYFEDFKNRVHSLHSLYLNPGLYDRRKKEYNFFKVMKGIELFVKRGDISQKDFRNLQWTKIEMGPYIEIAFDDAEEHDSYLNKFYKIVAVFQDKSHPLMAFRRDYILAKK
ncbi:MAG: class I SAM-dependent methyltransferase [Candidatus Moranbacteria bacterium]|nr:class I SAM-dependent methyltransferase [Candidatus Moranbacteria bacterium]